MFCVFCEFVEANIVLGVFGNPRLMPHSHQSVLQSYAANFTLLFLIRNSCGLWSMKRDFKYRVGKEYKFNMSISNLRSFPSHPCQTKFIAKVEYIQL